MLMKSLIMKKTIFSIYLIFIGIVSLQAQESNFELIEKTLSYYLEGGTTNNFEMLKKAFHPTATMKFVGDKYTEVNAIEFFKKGMKPGPKQNRKTRIVSINVSGNAANAQLEIEYPTFMFIDYMNMLKINGEWKIVSKIFYKKIKNESK